MDFPDGGRWPIHVQVSFLVMYLSFNQNEVNSHLRMRSVEDDRGLVSLKQLLCPDLPLRRHLQQEIRADWNRRSSRPKKANA